MLTSSGISASRVLEDGNGIVEVVKKKRQVMKNKRWSDESCGVKASRGGYSGSSLDFSTM